MEVVVICTNTFNAAQIKEWVAAHPMPNVRVLFDQGFLLYPAFNVGNGGWELPRVLLIDVDGTVFWEGDLNLILNQGWVKGTATPTPLDLSIEALIAKRKLKELDQLGPDLAAATQLFEKGKLREALKRIAPLADLEADFDQRVRDARHLRDTIEAIGAALPVSASQALLDGSPLLAHALLSRAIDEFPSTGVADLSRSRRRKLERDPVYRDALKAWKSLERAFKDAERGKDAATITANLDKALSASTSAEIVKTVTQLRAKLTEGGSAAMVEAWPLLLPSAAAAAE